MKGFIYDAPTKVIFGEKTEFQVGKELKSRGAKSVLLHYGSERMIKDNTIGPIVKCIEDEGIKVVMLGGVKPNPRLSLVNKGISFAKENNVDFILAVGGGSVIDSAKAIGAGLYNGGDVWDFFTGDRIPTGCTPLCCILTLAATGSEMGHGTVINNEKTGQKTPIKNCPYTVCTFAIEDPLLTLSLPKYQTASGSFDIIMHTIERYFFNGERTILTDSIAEGLLRSVATNTIAALKNPSDIDARGELMWASSLSHNGLTECGNGSHGDWACHNLSHELSAKYDSAHGAAIASLWGSWAKYVYKSNPLAFAKLGRNVFGVSDTGNVDKDAVTSIEAVVKFIEQIGLPSNIKDLIGKELSDGDIEGLADGASLNGTKTMGAIKSLNRVDMVAIYKAARK
jgi:alcohol dehydrogenase YqhD (iron-dependent ADH family)